VQALFIELELLDRIDYMVFSFFLFLWHYPSPFSTFIQNSRQENSKAAVMSKLLAVISSTHSFIHRRSLKWVELKVVSRRNLIIFVNNNMKKNIVNASQVTERDTLCCGIDYSN